MEANTNHNNKKNLFMKNNDGIALITVLLAITILGLLAVAGIYELDYNVINAGEHQTMEYAQNISNAGINVLYSPLVAGGNPAITGNTFKTTTASLIIPSITSLVLGDYYYTVPDNGDNGGTIQPPPASTTQQTTYYNLTASNLLSPALSQSILYNTLGNSTSGPQLGFEYTVTCWAYEYQTSPSPLYYYYYTGFINVISQDNANSKLVETGANFTYGPASQSTGGTCIQTTNPI